MAREANSYGGRRGRAALLGGVVTALALLAGAGPAAGQGIGNGPGPPVNLAVQRGPCGEPAAITWDAPAAPTEAVFRYEIRARNAEVAGLPADWVAADVSGWSAWTVQWTDTSEQFGAATPGAYDVGITAVGATGPGPTEWITVPPCRPGPVTNLTAALVAADRVRITWTPPAGAGSAFWKHQIYLNRPGWSSWEEDAGTTAVELDVPGSGGVLPQVRVAATGWSSGPATWFCDPPSRFCING